MKTIISLKIVNKIYEHYYSPNEQNITLTQHTLIPHTYTCINNN